MLPAGRSCGRSVLWRWRSDPVGAAPKLAPFWQPDCRRVAPIPLFLALAQRLVAEAALGDGWCDPEPLLRSAEATFESLDLARAANACRGLLKALGSPAPRRRKNDTRLHPTLRAAGVTSREAEVLDLLVERLTNREIAQRLYLSPRTVEKHVASLLDKLAVERTDLAHVARTLR